MRVALLVGLTLLVTGCDFVESLARGGGPTSAYAQTAMMDTAGVVARRVAAALPGGLDARLIDMLPDGRSGVTIDSDMGDVVLYELASGTVTRLTHNSKPFWPGSARGSVDVSPDGRHVAYPWEERVDTLGNGLIGIRVLDLEGGPPRVVYQGGDANEESTLVGGWSPDGRSLSAVIGNAQGDWSVVTIDVGSPGVPTVRALGWRPGGRIEYSPDGRFLAYDRPSSSEDEARDVYVFDLARNRELEVVASPTDDRLLGWMPGSGELLFQSDRSGTTGVWTQRLDGGRAAGDPVLVHPDFWGALPRSITADGRLYFAIQTGGYRTMVADVDLGANALRNVEPLVPGSETGWYVSHFGFSEDGSSTGIVTQSSLGNRLVLSVRSEATREIREYPLPIQVVYAYAPSFSRDGNTAALNAEVVGGLPIPPGSAWNAIVRVDLTTGRMEIDEVVYSGLRLLPDGRSALTRRYDPPAEGTDPESGVSTYAIRDLARHTERVLLQMENSVSSGRTPDGQSVLILRASRPGGPREAFLTPLDGSSGPRPISDSPLLLPAGGEVRFDPSGGALIAVFEEAERTDLGVFARHSVEALTWERIPLDGSPRTSTTVRFPDEFPAMAVLRAASRPTVSPRADRILYLTGGAPAYELWVLEGLPGGAPTSARDR